MIPPSLSKWDNIEDNEGLLFFAQCLCEMLFNYTLDSYKAPALNLHINIIELKRLCQRYDKNTVKKGALAFSIEELKKRIADGTVFSEDVNDKLRNYVKLIENNIDDPRKVFVLASTLHVDIQEEYWECLKKNIILVVTTPNKKHDIYKLALEFATELGVRGYSKNYVFAKVKKFFFSPRVAPLKISDCSVITQFLEMFENKTEEWSVVFVGEGFAPTFQKYAQEFGVTITSTAPAELVTVNKFKKFTELNFTPQSYFIKLNVTAKDPHTARDYGEYRLDFFIDACRFHNHKEKLKYNGNGFVYNNSSLSLLILRPSKPMECGILYKQAEDDHHFQTTLEILNGKHFKAGASYALRKVLDFHHAAAESSNLENQLLDLWAALESFLPPSNHNVDRIVNYTNYILPSLTLTYNDKIFRNLVLDLKECGECVVEHIEATPVEGEFFDKVVNVVASCDLADWRNILLGMLNNHPLLRYRLFYLSQIFKSSKNIHKNLVQHKNKVKLHLSRIYTMRNQIIHSAESFPYLMSLVENLHDYLDTLILTVSSVGKRKGVGVDIEIALEIISTNEKMYLLSLEGKNIASNSINCSDLVFGKNNVAKFF